jgi:hypothetical protein
MNKLFLLCSIALVLSVEAVDLQRNRKAASFLKTNAKAQVTRRAKIDTSHRMSKDDIYCDADFMCPKAWVDDGICDFFCLNSLCEYDGDDCPDFIVQEM